jgi:hypothetical protein
MLEKFSWRIDREILELEHYFAPASSLKWSWNFRIVRFQCAKLNAQLLDHEISELYAVEVDCLIGVGISCLFKSECKVLLENSG